MKDDDPIRRADALPPPTIAEIALLHWIAVLVREKPERLDALVERAQDKALAAEVRRLHSQEGSPEWVKAFSDAEIRISSAAEMLRRELAADPPKKKRKKR